MNVNVAVLFLALLIGVAIGYFIGYTKTVRTFNGFLNRISEEMLKAAKVEEERKRKSIESVKELVKALEELKKDEENE